jgi:hypothetical protein
MARKRAVFRLVVQASEYMRADRCDFKRKSEVP